MKDENCFLNIPLLVSRRSDLSGSDKLVFGCLMMHACGTGECWPKQALISEEVDLSVRAVGRSIRTLVDKRLIVLVRRQRKSAIYQITEGTSPSDPKELPYVDYLKSKYWRSFRKGAIDRAGKRCQTCNTEGGLDVHHRTYERLGCEDPRDVVVLCRDCHEIFHKNSRVKKP